MPKVTIVRGISGAGKTTFAETNYPDAVVVAADDAHVDSDGVYRFDLALAGQAHDMCFSRFCAALAGGSDVVVANTNTSLREISRYMDPAVAAGFPVEIVSLFCDPEVGKKRNVHAVPAEVVDRQHATFVQTTVQMVLPEGVEHRVVVTS